MMRIEPTISAPGQAADWRRARRPVSQQPERPLLLTLIAFALIASGIGLTAVTLHSWSELQTTSNDLGLGEYWRHAVLVLAAVSLFAGLLLVSGARLGWYLALLVLTNYFLAAIQAGLLAIDFGVPFTFADGSTFGWYAKHSIRALLGLLLLCYLLTSRVRRCYAVPIWKGALCMTMCALAGSAFAIARYLQG